MKKKSVIIELALLLTIADVAASPAVVPPSDSPEKDGAAASCKEETGPEGRAAVEAGREPWARAVSDRPVCFAAVASGSRELPGRLLPPWALLRVVEPVQQAASFLRRAGPCAARQVNWEGRNRACWAGTPLWWARRSRPTTPRPTLRLPRWLVHLPRSFLRRVRRCSFLGRRSWLLYLRPRLAVLCSCSEASARPLPAPLLPPVDVRTRTWSVCHAFSVVARSGSLSRALELAEVARWPRRKQVAAAEFHVPAASPRSRRPSSTVS